MKLVLNTPGIRVSKRGNCFTIKRGNIKENISCKKVEQIMITTSASITTDAIELALKNDIDIVFINKIGIPYGRVWNSKINSISTIRRNQLSLRECELGMKLIKDFINKKLSNYIKHLEILSKNRRDERKEVIKQSIHHIKLQILKINNIKDNLCIDAIRNTIQGYEGIATKTYFRTISYLLPNKYEFKNRTRNPARDEYNRMLNYGYGMMYQTIERICIRVGLDPHIGILHIDNYNTTSLVFDIIEMYRIYIDKIVFKLFTTKKINDNLFDRISGGYYLNNLGKRLLIYEYNKLMKSKEVYKGKKVEVEYILLLEIQSIASKILKEL